MAREKPRFSGHGSPVPMADHTETTSSVYAQAPRITLAPWVKIALSIFAVIHVIAVYAEPFRFSTQAQSPAPAANAILIRDALKPYIDMMYLNHGYYFFAPNPGPSHLVACVFNELDFGQGQTSAPQSSSLTNAPANRILYPDKHTQRPRLLYHRYFMYTEFYNTVFMPPDLPEINETGATLPPEIKRGKELYAAMSQSLEKYFQTRYPNRRFQLFRVEHLLPTVEDYFENGIKLDDPRLYIELPESYQQLEPAFDAPLPPVPGPFRSNRPSPITVPLNSSPTINNADIRLGLPLESTSP